jgi:RimJ/RimL family protein N-acetyltransferase
MEPPKPNLFRGRLVCLTAPTEQDIHPMARWSQDADYLRAVDSDYARPLSAKDLAERLEEERSDPNGVTFHLRTVEGDRLIGFVALHEIEWNNGAGMLAIGIGDAAYRGRGYGSEALALILGYAFRELNLYRVGLTVISNNHRALRAYEKAGFRREGALRRAVARDGQRHDLVLMGILREEWSESQAEQPANEEPKER